MPFPVSIKGVLLDDDRVVLLENERQEWELPGGRLEAGEDPPVCLVTYGVLRLDEDPLKVSHEHKRIGMFRLDEIDNLPMPDGYRKSIRSWAKQTNRLDAGRNAFAGTDAGLRQ
jgi:hypothetical protein